MSYVHGKQSARDQRLHEIRELETQHRKLINEIRALNATKAAAINEAREAQKAAWIAKQDADMTIRRHTLRVHNALTEDTKRAAEQARRQALKDFPEPEHLGAARLKAAITEIDQHNRNCPRCSHHLAGNAARSRKSQAKAAAA